MITSTHHANLYGRIFSIFKPIKGQDTATVSPDYEKLTAILGAGLLGSMIGVVGSKFRKVQPLNSFVTGSCKLTWSIQTCLADLA